MKKIFITIICCLTILLYIPFNTYAIAYDGQLSDIPNVTDLQLSKINELVTNQTNSNLLIFFNPYSKNLYWSFDIKSYNYDTKIFNINDIFYMRTDGSVNADSSNYNIELNGNYYIIYAFYQNKLIFINPNLSDIIDQHNNLLLSTSYENIVRTHSTSAAASNRTRYFSYVDYDIRYTIKGINFDVYYLVDGTYKLIQSSINTFTLYNHESKSKFKDSSTPDDYPDYPTIPNDSLTTYYNDFKLFNFLFKISDPGSNNLIVKAPDTDKLLSDGNSNSQSSTTNNNQSNQLLENTINNMDQLENNYKSDLNTNLDNINVNDFNISGITQLSNAANFVRVQFDNLTKNNPFGIILGFSLFLGLSLLIIGKRL